MADNFANKVLDLELLRESIAKHPDLIPGVQKFLLPFDAALAKVRGLNARRVTLIADKQQATQDLKAAVAEAQNLAIDIRAVIRGEVGARSEKLVEFGVAPLRKRSSRTRPAGETKSA